MPLGALALVALLAPAGGAVDPPRLVGASLDSAPWNVNSGGIAAYDVTIDARGAVQAANLVQDVAPYGASLGAALPSWRFEPARAGGQDFT